MDLGCSQHSGGGGHDYSEPGTVGDSVDREAEETLMEGLPRSTSEKELGITKVLRNAQPKASPPIQQILQGCAPIPGRYGEFGSELIPALRKLNVQKW